MVYVKTKITEDLYRELRRKDPQMLNDYGFEWLYDKGYINNDREYKGCFLQKNEDGYAIIFRTWKYE